MEGIFLQNEKIFLLFQFYNGKKATLKLRIAEKMKFVFEF
jgi:hypothetical protein